MPKSKSKFEAPKLDVSHSFSPIANRLRNRNKDVHYGEALFEKKDRKIRGTSKKIVELRLSKKKLAGDENLNFDENKPKKSKLKRYKSSSNETTKAASGPELNAEQKKYYKKYGVIVPTFEEIRKDKEDLENQKRLYKNILPLLDKDFNVDFNENNSTQKKIKKYLHCKHLSLEKLHFMFKKNLSDLIDIMNGRLQNDRHDKYNDIGYKDNVFSFKSLTYCPTMVLFEREQLMHLLDMFDKHFDPGDKARYFMQVLLPELCLRIFMETYGMDREESVQYLDEQNEGDDSSGKLCTCFLCSFS